MRPNHPFLPFAPVLTLLILVALLASCSAPPKPPAVDESRKRPVNSITALDLQTCKSSLQNARILASESDRLTEARTAAMQAMAARQQAQAAQNAAQQRAPQGNDVFTVVFEFASTRVEISESAAKALVDSARGAPLILLRGRTDGTDDSLAESRIARDRASAVRAYLIAAGIHPMRIRATYQAVGDHIADNTASNGRALNRRVEIEIYRAMPTVRSLSGTAASPS